MEKPKVVTDNPSELRPTALSIEIAVHPRTGAPCITITMADLQGPLVVAGALSEDQVAMMITTLLTLQAKLWGRKRSEVN